MQLLFINFEESFFILLVAFLIFGPQKMPYIARSLGKNLRYFHNVTQEMQRAIWEVTEKSPYNTVSKEPKTKSNEIDENLS
ncbi:Sec-independent protein translocase subunit TatA/TatB [Candidatus Walczuchella monophlebidarum]|uniref:Putative Sec-independent-protein-translocase protein TatA/E n=1 Tax=Candidatus Walczuchella monophlebidarum TaxID=1415657 RepID=A0A068DSM7_9FLAO|nr:twin-arginine translocase TatA/TatE family subunit [Candidatus Walczuchella monophlebidarum]AID37389.1 putative Sec-independent-protein-translocase protein TatA/E [Candidatus Walczuchella monophlebidarum]